MSEWPTNTDLAEALNAAGIPVPVASVLTSALALSVEAFQDATGWYPFAASSTATASTVPLFWPDSALVSVVSFGGGVLTSTTPTVTLDGSTLEAATDYILCPPDASRRGVPYTYLKLLRRKVGNNNALSITGIFGYCAYNAVPELARAAVLAYAAMDIAAPSIQAGTATRVLAQAEEGEVKYQWGSSIEERQAAMRSWQTNWDMAIAKFQQRKVF